MIRSLFNQANSSELSEQQPELSRRRFLRAGLGACAVLALPMGASTAHAAIRRPFEKKLSFLNLHTGERTQATFWANGRYIPESMRAINYVLRDHRTGDRVFGLMVELNAETRTSLVIVTHDLARARSMDRVLQMEDGRLHDVSGAVTA